MKALSGKIAVITGPGSGIGRVLTYWLNRENAGLALADIDLNGLQETQLGIKNNALRILIGKDARQIDYLARFRPNSYDKVVTKYIKKHSASC